MRRIDQLTIEAFFATLAQLDPSLAQEIQPEIQPQLKQIAALFGQNTDEAIHLKGIEALKQVALNHTQLREPFEDIYAQLVTNYQTQPRFKVIRRNKQAGNTSQQSETAEIENWCLTLDAVENSLDVIKQTLEEDSVNRSQQIAQRLDSSTDQM